MSTVGGSPINRSAVSELSVAVQYSVQLFRNLPLIPKETTHCLRFINNLKQTLKLLYPQKQIVCARMLAHRFLAINTTSPNHLSLLIFVKNLHFKLVRFRFSFLCISLIIFSCSGADGIFFLSLFEYTC